MKTLTMVLCLGLIVCGLAFAGQITNMTPGADKGALRPTTATEAPFTVFGGTVSDRVAPFPEGFESTTGTAPPAGWLIVNSNADVSLWATTSSYYYSGSRGCYYNYNSASSADDWLISSGAALTGGTSYRVSFWYKIGSASYPERYEILYGTTQSVAGMTTTIVGPTDVTSSTWTQDYYDFTPAATGTYYIGWHCISDADMWYIAIDDLDLNETPVTGRCCYGSPMQCTDGVTAAECAALSGEFALGLTCATPCPLPCNEIVLCGPSSEVEPNDACPPPEAQTVIGCNSIIYGLICPEDDMDYYKVVVPAGYRMSIAQFDGDNCETIPTTCILTDVYYDDCTIGGSGGDGIWNLSNPSTVPWTVYMEVYGTGECRSPYLLVATCCEIKNYCEAPIWIPGVFHYEQTVNTCCATQVYPGTYEDACSGSAYGSGMQVIFRICLESSGTLTLNVTGPSTADEQIMVFTDCNDPMGTCVGSQDMEAGSIFGETISDLALTAGCYFVGVNYYSYYGTTCGDLTLTIDSDVLLPVELLGFEAVPGDDQVMLRWRTASETGSDHFEIERNGSFVRRINAAGDATGHSYSWVDRSVSNNQTYHYSLWAVEINGERSLLSETDATPRAGASFLTDYALHGNYPNPFNPTTEIAFDLPVTANVSLKVFDLMGREVADLVNGEKAAGTHTITFDASDLPSGVYICRMTAGGFSATHKMMLLR